MGQGYKEIQTVPITAHPPLKGRVVNSDKVRRDVLSDHRRGSDSGDLRSQKNLTQEMIEKLTGLRGVRKGWAYQAEERVGF